MLNIAPVSLIMRAVLENSVSSTRNSISISNLESVPEITSVSPILLTVLEIIL